MHYEMEQVMAAQVVSIISPQAMKGRVARFNKVDRIRSGKHHYRKQKSNSN